MGTPHGKPAAFPQQAVTSRDQGHVVRRDRARGRHLQSRCDDTVKAGTFIYEPPNGHDYDMAKDEEVIVEIIGIGPVLTTSLEPGRDADDRITEHRPAWQGSCGC